MVLSGPEDCAIGAICGVADPLLLQWTVYYKSALQNPALPLRVFNPAVLYRGVTAMAINNGFTVSSQFFLNGMIKKYLTGGEDRPLSVREKLVAGATAGSVAGFFVSPFELAMSQQQIKGGSLPSTLMSLMGDGPMTLFRGSLGMALREGIYCAGYMGILPAVREKIRKDYPDTFWGKTEDRARICAAFVAGPICTMVSHPPDTVKSCMQLDVEQSKFKGYTHTIRTLVGETGIKALWRGVTFRMGRQFCCVILFDKIATELSPMLFPHAFRG